MRFAVTTGLDAGADAIAAARQAAGRWQVPFHARRGAGLAAVAREADVAALLVLSPRRAALWVAGELTAWDGGMGALRVKRMRAGEGSTRDGFLDAARLRAGDAVLDCTLGLGADALVAAEAVGPEGRVVGLEASAPLAALTAEGLRRLGEPLAARVDVHHADAAAWLAAAPSASFDVVVFDPMFREPLAQPAAFDLVRQLADPRPLSATTLADAARVARRSVVVKDGAPGRDLARLGLVPIARSRGARRCYARIDGGPPARPRS
jgi:hypothetical protein